MMDSRVSFTLEAAIQKWMNDNCDEDWWLDSIGYVSMNCAQHLSQICSLTLEESKLGQELAKE